MAEAGVRRTRRLERPRSCRKIERGDIARNVSVSVGVDGDIDSSFLNTAAEVGRVGEHRVDDQRPAAIMRGHLKADLIRALEHVAPGDFASHTVNLLVDDWLLLAD